LRGDRFTCLRYLCLALLLTLLGCRFQQSLHLKGEGDGAVAPYRRPGLVLLPRGLDGICEFVPLSLLPSSTPLPALPSQSFPLNFPYSNRLASSVRHS
jgi:hypothetical protein